jgi:hypothetical protein
MLDEWAKEKSGTSSGGEFASFETNAETTKSSTDLNGDKNVWHVPGKFKDYEELISQLVETNEPEDENWAERRGQRHLNESNLYGSILPGMHSIQEYLEEETRRGNAVQSFSASFTNPIFTGDEVKIKENNEAYEVLANPPQEENSWKQAIEIVDVKYGDFDPEHNKRIYSAATQMVGRRNRDLDMLVQADIEIYDEIDLEELEWDKIESTNETLEEGRLNTYKAEMQVDNQTIGEYTETYVNAEGSELLQNHEEGPPVQGPAMFTIPGATANILSIFNS